MINRVILLMAIFVIALSSKAKNVTVEKAQLVAEKFYKIQTNKQNVIISDVYTEKSEDVTTLYVFMFKENGFVIVSADDVVQPILGYSISSKFDKNNISPQLKEILNQYSKGIYNEITLNSSNNKLIEWENILSGNIKSTTSFVTPLCSTLWAQTCWYNELCPFDTLGTCGHAVTGCVATAITQVMKFWNYPSKGQGTHSYTSQWHGVQTADFGSTTYLWDSMPNVLTQSNLAVATLMYHVGVSVDMDYYDNSSSSNLYYALTSLPQYFKYSNNIQFVYRNSYSDSAWIELMKSELNHGRPILYQGLIQGVPSGHAWVCDGYDNNDFLHFNWGDGNDGYFEIGNFIWNNSNEAVIKVMPIVSCDIALRNFVSPVSQTFSAPSTIKVKISNYDTLPVTNIPVSYTVDGGIPVNEIIQTPIAALSDTIYEFTQPFDFSQLTGHVYNVKVYSTLLCDGYKDNDTIATNIENVACVTPPYFMGFEPSENYNGWLISNVNNDGNTWNYGFGGNTQPTCAYYSGGLSNANDWLFSKCLQLDANKMYKLSYYYKGMGQFYPNKLGVYLNYQQNSSAITLQLADDTNIVNDSYLKKELFFIVPTTGSYYLGWYSHSNPENYTFLIDDINITEQTATDIGVLSTSLPTESCNLQQENLEVKIRNFCSSALSNIPISYSVNGGTPITETITTSVLPGDTLVYTFSVPVDLSANGIYNIKIYTSLAGDSIFNNDTLTALVTNHIAITPNYTFGFEPTEDFSGWKIYNNNNDSYSWSIKNTGGRTLPYCIRYDYSSWLPADDWFVSSCVNLASAQSYKLGFWYKIESSQWPEKLKVFIGNSQQNISQGTQLLNFPNLTNQTYQNAEVNFTVPSDGLYYIGWYCYSDSLMFNLYIDDIYLDIATKVSENNNFKDEYILYPNPCENSFTVINSNKYVNETKYELTTLGGEKIFDIYSKKNTIKITTENLLTGIYFLKIFSNKGVVVKKLIKQ